MTSYVAQGDVVVQAPPASRLFGAVWGGLLVVLGTVILVNSMRAGSVFPVLFMLVWTGGAAAITTHNLRTKAWTQGSDRFVRNGFRTVTVPRGQIERFAFIEAASSPFTTANGQVVAIRRSGSSLPIRAASMGLGGSRDRAVVELENWRRR